MILRLMVTIMMWVMMSCLRMVIARPRIAQEPEELQLSKPPQEMIIALTCMYYRGHCVCSFVNFLDWLRCRHSWHGFYLLCKFCYCDCVNIFCRMGAFWNLGISVMCHFFLQKRANSASWCHAQVLPKSWDGPDTNVIKIFHKSCFYHVIRARRTKQPELGCSARR